MTFLSLNILFKSTKCSFLILKKYIDTRNNVFSFFFFQTEAAEKELPSSEHAAEKGQNDPQIQW